MTTSKFSIPRILSGKFTARFLTAAYYCSDFEGLLALKKIYILHLGNYLLKPDSGVAQKSFALAQAMRDVGREAFLVAISDQVKPAVLPPFLEIRTASRADYIKEAHRFFESLNPDDLVLFRHPFASLGLLNLVKRYGKQIIFEHNTIEQAEMLLMQREHFNRQPFSWSWSYLKYAIQTIVLKSTIESRLGPSVLAHVLGGVCVSDEIRHYECDRHKLYRAVTIANGAEKPSHYNLKSAPLKEEMVVAMLIGSEAIWHGYERLFSGLMSNPVLSKRVVIQIIGIDKPASFSWPTSQNHKVEWLGKKSKQEISDLLQDCHIAVGTLALFRKSMKEASPLKVRECLMLGLPMIIGYFDTDLSADNRFEPFLFKVENNESPIDWQAIESWYTKLSEHPENRQKLGDLASEVLSMNTKAKQYLEFLDGLSQ
jgi:hypothetical protein